VFFFWFIDDKLVSDEREKNVIQQRTLAYLLIESRAPIIANLYLGTFVCSFVMEVPHISMGKMYIKQTGT